MDALLEAVLREPDDVPARLVFSDWLMDHGDPRGEFIQLQCALNRPLTGAGGKTWHRPIFDGDPTALQKRERALIKLHEKQWLLEIRPFIRTWRWSRGFVDHVVADSAKFLSGVERIFATTPLVDVQLTALKKPMLQTLSTQATTARLRALDVHAQKLDAAALALFDAENWRGLRRLNLGGNRFGVEGAQVLARVRGLNGLESLTLNDAQMTDACLEALVQAPFFARLTDLELGWNDGITGRGGLLVARAGTSLKKLKLRSTNLTSADFVALAQAAPQLEYVRVSAGFVTQVRPYFGAHVTIED